jgi:outer membrane protein OmpA-like peptidoglycan-associated protein
MGGRALQATPQDINTTRDRDETGIKSPGLRLLDALRDGDDPGVLAVCGPTTTVSAANMTWSCRGREQIQVMLAEARERFPGLTFESRTRHVGFGLVIDEARVRDVDPLAGSDDVGDDVGQEVDGEPDGPSLADHPMYDHPMHAELAIEDRAPTGRALTLWRDTGGDEPVAPLDLPVRVTVLHDDLQVHEVTLSFPAALLKRALGMHVDPFELSLSEVQSAFVAPAGTDLTTRTLARPELTLVPGAPDQAPPESEVVDDEPRRRRRWRWPVMLAVLALVAVGAWWAIQGRGSGPEAAPSPARPTASASPQTSPSGSLDPSPSARPSASQAPTVTRALPSDTPSRKPNVTLRSDLAFGFNSARLSPEAKTAIDQVARQVVSAGLHGRIFVDGYTDSTGSAAYGVVLSQRRADTVSTYLQSRLLGAPVSIVSTGHGEADPVTDNATAAGRKANRRVTITLPRP